MPNTKNELALLALANIATEEMRDTVTDLVEELGKGQFTDTEIAGALLSVAANLAGNTLGFVASHAENPESYVADNRDRMADLIEKYADEILVKIKEHEGAGHA